ncbi:hypothetical protein [Microbacterium sp. A94]|uniref:hypothetical protein n=1 Tax=Microbacterium sp. A94 TaxID=3450717 RepID=UPI003F6E3BAD
MNDMTASGEDDVPESGEGDGSPEQPASTPARVRVTAPSTGVAGATTRPLPHLGLLGPTSDIAGVYVRSLIRSQLRLAVVFAVGFVVATTLFVLAIVLVPGLDSSYLFGVPVSWLLLGVGIYPLTLTVAGLYVRVASRNEARYRSLTEPE